MRLLDVACAMHRLRGTSAYFHFDCPLGVVASETLPAVPVTRATLPDRPFMIRCYLWFRLCEEAYAN